MHRKFSLFLCLQLGLLFPFCASATPAKIYWCLDGQFGGLNGAQFAKLLQSNLDGSSIFTVRTATDGWMRGCHFDSALDQFFLSEKVNDIVKVAPDNSSSQTLQTFIPAEPLPEYNGSIAIDPFDTDPKMYFTNGQNWTLLRASSTNPLNTALFPYQNVPQQLTLTNAQINSPFDLEIDPFERVLYFTNGGGSSGGSIGRYNLDDSGSATIIETSRPVRGIAVDAIHKQLFYTLDNSTIWTASLDGSNPTELTPVIGPMTRSAHFLMDIDYEPDTNKIYWMERNDPALEGLDGPGPGVIRRADPDGTNVETVVSNTGNYGSLITFQYGTLAAELSRPSSSTTYVTKMGLSYSLGEPPKSGTVKINFKQSGVTKATLNMKDFPAIATSKIFPLSADPDPDQFSNSSSGFPLTPGTYAVELSYQDIPGNPAYEIAADNVVLAEPTPTPTNTPTPTATPTVTLTPTVTPTATIVINVAPTATPTVTPTPQCTSLLKLPKVKIRGKTATISFSGKKGQKYKVIARPLGALSLKAKNKKKTASENAKLEFSFDSLKKGLWEFSYSATFKKVTTTSCRVQKTVR